MPVILVEMPNWPSRNGANITEIPDAASVEDGTRIAQESLLPEPGQRKAWIVERTEDYIFPTMETVREVCEELSGSGIDDRWSFFDTRTSFRACNSFHVMNENGYYVAWVDFAVIFYKKRDVFRFNIVYQSNRYYGERIDLKDMLYEWVEFRASEVFGTALAGS